MVQDTSTYHMAYAVATIVYAGYIASLWWRAKKANARLEALQTRAARPTKRGGGR